MAFAQTHRQARFRLQGDDEMIVLETFEADERLGEPFVLTAGVISQGKEIDFLKQLGQLGEIDIYDQYDNLQRHFSGVLTDAVLISGDENGYHYRLTFRPWLWLLTLNQNYQIFQELNALDIISQIFQQRGFTDFIASKLTRRTEVREYCVQFNESDFAFVSRLMEEEGIYYYFDYAPGKHTLVLADSISAHAAVPQCEKLPFMPSADGGLTQELHIFEWSERIASTPRMVSLRDFNFETPSSPIDSDGDVGGQYTADQAEVFDWPGGFGTPQLAKALAKQRGEAERAERRVFDASGHLPTMACGGLFTLKDHEIARYNDKYLVVGQRYVISPQGYTGDRGVVADDGRVVRVDVEVTPSTTPWRRRLLTPRPVARGPQTAIVTGPVGEEVHVDKYGRVKVHFHWDRKQAADEKSSCWIRVSHGWAGLSYGVVNLPRIGQEVIVDFLDGDPDQPIITGRVYNARQTVAQTLPDNKTRSYWKTQTVGGVGFNEIGFEDKADAELFYMHAQKDMRIEVLHDRDHTINGNEKLIVDGTREETIGQGDTLTVNSGGKSETISAGDYKIDVSSGGMTVDAAVQIKLTVGPSSITIDQMGIKLEAPTIELKSPSIKIDGALTEIKAAMLQVDGGAMAAIKAALVTIN